MISCESNERLEASLGFVVLSTKESVTFNTYPIQVKTYQSVAILMAKFDFLIESFYSFLMFRRVILQHDLL